MKKSFKEYYRPEEEEFRELWKNCLFVPDANVLLSFYRYSTDTAEQLFEIFGKISSRLWVPHQVGLEYQKNRLNVISEQAEAYDVIIKELSSTKESLKSKIGRYNKHPYIKLNDLINKLEKFCSTEIRKLESGKSAHPDLFKEDMIGSRITNIFEGRVGESYIMEELTSIYEQGKNRYEKMIPPGYQDSDKPNEDKYGDLVIWFQIIDKAKKSGKPIIFIIDDMKEDWWHIFKGKIMSPRPELINEIYEKANVGFYMYQSDRFMEYAGEYLDQKVTQRAINEIRDFRIDKEGLLKELRKREKELIIQARVDEIAVLEDKVSMLRNNLKHMNDLLHILDNPKYSDVTESTNKRNIVVERSSTMKELAMLQNELRQKYKDARNLQNTIDDITENEA